MKKGQYKMGMRCAIVIIMFWGQSSGGHPVYLQTIRTYVREEENFPCNTRACAHPHT